MLVKVIQDHSPFDQVVEIDDCYKGFTMSAICDEVFRLGRGVSVGDVILIEDYMKESIRLFKVKQTGYEEIIVRKEKQPDAND